MRAQFAIRKDRRTRLFFGRTVAYASTAMFTRGPSYALTMVTDFLETIGGQALEAGFMLDFDTRVALIYDTGICWDPEEAALYGWVVGPRSRAMGFAQLDLWENEEPLIEAAQAAETVEAYFEALRTLSQESDSWLGWTLRWGTGKDYTAAVAGGALEA